jgi:hypothetical protein
VNHWPTAVQASLLQAGLLRGDEAVEAWHRIEPGLDLRGLDPASVRLLPLVHANLARRAPRARRLADLRDVYASSWLWNQRLLARARRLVGALRSAGIEALALKGLALVLTSYRDVGARPMGDVDVMVPVDRVRAATRVLRAAGWAPSYTLTPGFLRVRHAAPFRLESGEECDLHWRVFEEGGPTPLDDDWWRHSTAVDMGGAEIRVLCPADQLLHVCIHGAKWTPLPSIRWIADAITILEAGGIDWPRLVAGARARRFTLRARETLCYLSSAMGASIPADVLQRLSGLPVSPLERLERRLRNRAHPRLGELPLYWCNYVRARPRAVLRPLGFARYLQAAWDLPSLADVPGHALALAVRRLTAPRVRPSAP